jgi:hypothetical protein
MVRSGNRGNTRWNSEIAAFADPILNGVPLTSGTADDALNITKIIYRIYYADLEWRAAFRIPNPLKEFT